MDNFMTSEMGNNYAAVENTVLLPGGDDDNDEVEGDWNDEDDEDFDDLIGGSYQPDLADEDLELDPDDDDHLPDDDLQ